MEPALRDYRVNKRSLGLFLKYKYLITKLAILCKGQQKEINPFFCWFYGLFLEGLDRGIINTLDARDRILRATQPLSYEDCYNQVALFFFELAKKYRNLTKAKKTNFHQYIHMVLGWRVKQWIDTLVLRSEHPVISGSLSLPEAENSWEEVTQPFTLNIAWVMNGSNNPLFQNLRAYERYLLYLYFVEDQTIVGIAKATYQSKNTVQADLQLAFTKCRKAMEL